MRFTLHQPQGYVVRVGNGNNAQFHVLTNLTTAPAEVGVGMGDEVELAFAEDNGVIAPGNMTGVVVGVSSAVAPSIAPFPAAA